MNLVGPGPIEVHYEDAARALEVLPEAVGRWVDLGTGAGFPGVVFAARFTGAEVALVDSRARRCAFLEDVLARARAEGVEVSCCRLETLPERSFDGVMSRALAAPEVMFDHARRLLRAGGEVVMFVQSGRHVDAPPGFELVASHRYEVAGKSRASAVFRWLGET